VSALAFGPFTIDPARGELRRNGVLIRLPRQPFVVLATLVARAGEVVPREELQRALWPEGTFVDFDRGLNFCINRVRRTLGEDARRPRYVETVARGGYRFMAAVHAVPAGSRAAAEPNPPGRSRAWGLGGATVAPPTLMMLVVLLATGGAGDARIGAAAVLAPPAGEAARAAYARGQYHARRAQGARESLEAFAEAVRLDARSASAAAGHAHAWLRAVEEGRVASGAGMPRAAGEARRAVALGEHPLGHFVLGAVALRHEWDWPEAERRLRRSIDLDPAFAPAHVELANVLLVRGRVAEALAAAEAAEAVDPVCPVVRGQVAASSYAARRFEAAADGWRRSTLVAPELVGPHERLVHAYRHAARPRDAAAEAARVVALLGGPAAALLAQPPDRAIAAFVRGTIAHLEREEAPALVADRIAVLHAVLGRRDDALRWLDVAARERSATLPVTLATDPDLDALRGDPAFRALVRRLALSGE
jgi:DNA-binding winged helix-turn-helix (wHTH) protein/tetratricopeptide (TPR) repeat protein